MSPLTDATVCKDNPGMGTKGNMKEEKGHTQMDGWSKTEYD